MKVVFCAYDGQNVINGINAWLLRLLPDLANNNIKVSVIFITWAAEKDCTTIPLLRAMGIKCTVIPTPQYTERFIKWILKHLNTEQTDVFVASNMVPALHACKWIQDAGIATVAMLHNDDLEHKAIIDEFLKDSKKSKLTAVVLVSQLLYQMVKSYNSNIKTYQIPYGAPVAQNKAALSNSKPFKVIYLGRIVKEQKRIDEITATFCACAKNLPLVQFCIYGSGPDAYMVHDIISRYNNPKNVFFLGSISPKMVQEILLSSHVIVLLSEYEGIPVALMEAMGCGVVPICKFISSGIPELIKDSFTGLLINDKTELLSKIVELQDNPDTWNKLSDNSQTLIRESFSSVNNTAKWLSLLGEFDKREKNISIPFKLKLAKANAQFGDLDRREPLNIVKAIRKIKRVFKN